MKTRIIIIIAVALFGSILGTRQLGSVGRSLAGRKGKTGLSASGQLDSEALKDLIEEKAMELNSSISAFNLELVEVKSSLAAKDVQIEILKKDLKGAKTKVEANEQLINQQRCETGTVHNIYGNRNYYHGRRITVNFYPPFAGTPKVMLAHAKMDVYNDRNLRMTLGAEDITRSGFKINANPWANTNIEEWSILWMACYV